MSDLKILKNALDLACRVGLLREFECSYREHRSAGLCVRKACWAALYDWDALPIGYREDGLYIATGVTT